MGKILKLKVKDKQIVIGLIKEPKDEIGEHDGFQVEPRYYKDFEQIIKNGWCYKYVEDDLIKGIIMAGNDGIRTTIYDIEVCKHSRRKGVGSKLLKHVVDKSIKEDYPVNIVTETYNYLAIGFYIKNKCSELRSMNVVRFETV